MNKSVVYTVHYVTGWKTVERDVKIPHNMQTPPLQIKTDSTAGSGEQVIVSFYTVGGDYAGGIGVYFHSRPWYSLAFCKSPADLPSTLPSDINKVWVITKLPGPRLTVQCNDVTVVDLTMSDDTCSDSNWREYWTKQIEQIKFASWDTASDEYWAPPGNKLIVFNITCLSSYCYHTVRIR